METKEQKSLERKASNLLSRNRKTKVASKVSRRSRRKNRYDETVVGYIEAEINKNNKSKNNTINAVKIKKTTTKSKQDSTKVNDTRLRDAKTKLSELQKVCNKQRKKIKDLQKQVKHLESLTKINSL